MQTRTAETALFLVLQLFRQRKIQQLHALDASTAFRSLIRNIQQKLAEIITTALFFSLQQESARDLLCLHAIRHKKESPESSPGKATTGVTDLFREDTAELLPLDSTGPENTIPTGNSLASDTALRKRHLFIESSCEMQIMETAENRRALITMPLSPAKHLPSSGLKLEMDLY